MLFVRVALANRLLDPRAFCRAVTSGLASRLVAVQLHQLRVIDIVLKCAVDGVQVCPVTVRGQLNPIVQTCRQIAHKVVCKVSITPADKPIADQLAICVQRSLRFTRKSLLDSIIV